LQQTSEESEVLPIIYLSPQTQRRQKFIKPQPAPAAAGPGQLVTGWMGLAALVRLDDTQNGNSIKNQRGRFQAH
jgi:hypothetical protein